MMLMRNIVFIFAVFFNFASILATTWFSGMGKKSIVFVTGNQGKLREVIEILEPHTNYDLVHKDIDLNEYQGDIDEICKRKCQDAYKITQGPVVVEDSSLCFNALGGLPGPYVKWFLKKVGPRGLYNMLLGFSDKAAVAVCTFGYADENGDITLFQGLTHGVVVEPRGGTGFGWDACFLPDGSNLTYGEMSREQKNEISHRRKALNKLKEFLLNKT